MRPDATTAPVNAGGRLDRLPIGPFHYRIMWLIGIGMFFDGFDIYIAGTVLGATLKSGFSTLPENALFVSSTFVGMMAGSFLTGFLGDRYGRRFTYQANLLIFGLAAIAAAFAPSMTVLIVLRFIMGVGLGAENVVGYSTMTEFVPARSRGRWLGLMAVFVVTGLPVASLAGYVVIPLLGWRAMFVLGGLGALGVWYLRKRLPESPRWLEAVGRTEEADALLREIEREAARGGALPPPAPLGPPAPKAAFATLFRPPLLGRVIVGCLCLIVINTLLYGFVTWLPTFFIKQGLSVATSFGYSLLMGLGAPIGSAIGALTADRWGRKPTIAGASAAAILFGLLYPLTTDPVLLPLVGFGLTVPIYVLVALLFGIYIPELFPTEVRLRASGLCNTFGRGATIVTPFIVVSLFQTYGIGGVMALMIGLLAVQIVTVLALGVEPRQQSLEEMKPRDLGGVQEEPVRTVQRGLA
ncbi:major facilitator superfamily MFS_1 [Methylobacterium sp. 4-46]|uniref:MFS transporter n=1 Tax=unclassified Methylobacterium TaxID=2615210 RepID=UPI000152E347|nr:MULTISPECIES: MFS transporter [Methylobacterium]ACA15090.1 major facilitator superfamily MFS_1 [Methylobacterium sp. 4-46]WFT80824.1 MFS transporter [Methylobacterium nodulans]